MPLMIHVRRIVIESYVWRKILIEILRLAPYFETLCLTCDFKTLRLTPARRKPDATFRNQKIVSGGRF